MRTNCVHQNKPRVQGDIRMHVFKLMFFSELQFASCKHNFSLYSAVITNTIATEHQGRI